MKINSLMALAAVALAVAAPASAAVVSYTQGDLLMGFHVSGGTGAGSVYVVDIGSAASFRDATGSMTLSLGNIGADLTSIFGSNWSTRTDLTWGIAGTSSNTTTVNGDPIRTLYASQAQITTGDKGTAWVVDTSTLRTTTSTRMQGMETAFKGYQATANSAFAAIEGSTDGNNYSSYIANGNATPNTPGGIDFGAFTGIEGTPAQALNLYRVTDGNPGAYEGTFSINPAGVVTFAVPEAASSLFVGASALLLAVRRRRNA